MRALLWVVVATLCLIGAVIARAPATLIDARVAAATGNAVRIADARGTIWDGTGTVRFAGASSGQPLTWHADPTSLVTGTLTIAFGTAAGAPRAATLAWSPSRVEIRRLDGIEIPVDALTRTLAPGVPAPLGALQVAIPQLAMEANSLAGQVRLAWQGAALPDATTGMPLRLGTVTAELGEANGALAGPVRGSGGEVDVAGTLTWRSPAPPAIDLTLTPRAGLARERQEAIASALARYGRPDGRGGFRIATSGPPR